MNDVELPKRKLRTMHLFAGAGGGILADLLLGHVPVCAVELAAYPRKVLLARQADGSLPRFPIWDDVTTFDGRPWKGSVDVVCGGFPCQDISSAGKGAGISGSRSGLWSEFARIICEVSPRFVFVENSPMLTSRGLGVVLGDLAELGYDARWGLLSAGDVGARHKRERMWITADALPIRERRDSRHEKITIARGESAQDQPEPARVVDVVARRVDRINAIGNGQVPQVAALAWRILSGDNE